MTTFVLSDQSNVNSHGFITDLSGMDVSRFSSNPVMLYQHDSERVIGRWSNLRIEDGKMMADAEFDVEDAIGKEVAGKVERGFLKGCSIGILVKDCSFIDETLVVTQSELLEASVVSIPADAGACVLYDENHQELSVEQLQTLSINKKSNNMAEKTQTLEELEALRTQMTEKDAKIAELEAKVEEMKKSQTEAYLAQAVSDGKITEAEKAGFAKLAAQDIESVKSIIDARPKKASAQLSTAIKNTATDGRDDWGYMDWMRKDNAGLLKMKAEDPERFARLYNEMGN